MSLLFDSQHRYKVHTTSQTNPIITNVPEKISTRVIVIDITLGYEVCPNCGGDIFTTNANIPDSDIAITRCVQGDYEDVN